GGRVGEGLPARHVGAQHVPQEVLAVPGQREGGHLREACGPDLAEERLRVLDRVALRDGVAAEEELMVQGERDRLCGRAAEVAAEEDGGGGRGGRACRGGRAARIAGEERGQRGTRRGRRLG